MSARFIAALIIIITSKARLYTGKFYDNTGFFDFLQKP